MLHLQLSQLCLNVTFTAVPSLSQCYIYSCPSSVSMLHLQLSQLCLNVTFPLLKCSHPLFLRLINQGLYLQETKTFWTITESHSTVFTRDQNILDNNRESHITVFTRDQNILDNNRESHITVFTRDQNILDNNRESHITVFVKKCSCNKYDTE